MFAMPVAFSFTGCGNVCDDAADICGGGEGEGEGEGECEGPAECAAQCIVDADSCDILGDADLAKCVTDCAGG